jgi:hypothetical protein
VEVGALHEPVRVSGGRDQLGGGDGGGGIGQRDPSSGTGPLQQVRVRVDESRQQCAALRVDHLGAVRRQPDRLDGHHAVTIDEHVPTPAGEPD